MRGNKPSPPQLHELAGNPGKRERQSAEPGKPLMDLKPPKQLKGPALATWKRLAPQLVADQTLNELSVSHFVAYCQAEALYAHMSQVIDDKIAKDEPLVETTPNGGRQQIAELGIQNRALEQMMKLGEMFAIDSYTRERRGKGRGPTPPAAKQDADRAFLRRVQ